MEYPGPEKTGRLISSLSSTIDRRDSVRFMSWEEHALFPVKQ
jgi:hypothetical protein